MKQLWIGVVEVLTEPESDMGDTRGFTNVVTWAESITDYLATVTTAFSRYDWTLIGSKNVRPVDPGAQSSEEIAEIIERAKANPNACIFATLHYYPSKLA